MLSRHRKIRLAGMSGDGAVMVRNKRRMIRRHEDISPSRGDGPKGGVSTTFQRPSLIGCSSGGLSDVLSDLSTNVFTQMQALPLDKMS